MFCNSCGSQVFAIQAVCGKCGSPILGSMTLSRVQRHLKLLGILWIAYAVFEGIGGGVLLIVANTIFGRHLANPGQRPDFLVSVGTVFRGGSKQLGVALDSG